MQNLLKQHAFDLNESRRYKNFKTCQPMAKMVTVKAFLSESTGISSETKTWELSLTSPMPVCTASEISAASLLSMVTDFQMAVAGLIKTQKKIVLSSRFRRQETLLAGLFLTWVGQLTRKK